MLPPRRFRHPIGAIERCARTLYSNTLQRFGFIPHVMRAQGARFLVDPSDFIDRCIAHEGIWEGAQLDALAAVTSRRRIDLFMDVGANTGFYSVMFAVKRLADRVMAFEPDPGNFARLVANLDANNLADRVTAIPLALGDRASEVTLYEGAKWNRGESTIAVPEQTPQQVTFKVRQIRFDDEYALKQQSIIIKMDVEGYEFHTLAGMERTLRENECYLQIELYSDRLEEMKTLFAGLGYRFLHTEYIDHFFTNMAGIE